MASAEPMYTPLAAWINEARERKGLSTRELAARLGWSESRLRYYTIPLDAPGRKWEADSDAPVEYLRALADVLGEPVDRGRDAYYQSRRELPFDEPQMGVNQRVAVAEMAKLDVRHQRLVADVVRVLAEGLRA